jgi:hypothetical protein
MPNVYVSPYPFRAGGHRKVTNDSGFAPQWSRNGRELFVLHRDGSLQVLQISTAPTLTWTNPTTLFSLGYGTFGSGFTDYVASADGSRFVARVPVSRATGGDDKPQEIHVVINWFEELKRLVPTN